eukprot:TRINITY_DN2979_c0_g1_i4.p1 TRINITY_DN2979_c0_g1~~TRINITY_DN2979_c0_g1_i4.p1  ORF type:complete len:438 (+),score=103.72 TRINITY_DN2979_c0_g1_i4:182-1315(+)
MHSKYSEEERRAHKEKENQALLALEKKLEENGVTYDKSIHTPLVLNSFLKAHRLDVDAAYEGFTACLKWRAENNVDTLLQDAPTTNPYFEILSKYWPAAYHGTDKEGALIYIEKAGSVDVKGLVTSVVPEEHLIYYHVYLQEQGRVLKAQQTEKLGKSCHAHIIIEDLNGLGWGSIYTPGMDIMRKCINIDQSYYPNTLKKYYVVNAPAIVTMLFKMVSPWLDTATAAKVNILGSDYQETLLADIDASELPVEFGGTSDFVVTGGGPYSGAKDDGSMVSPLEVTVGRQDKYEARVIIENERSLITWKFSTVGYDIGFGIQFETASGEREAVVAIDRVNSHEEAIEGCYTAEKTGTYFLVWDNTFSTWTKKTLTYLVT